MRARLLGAFATVASARLVNYGSHIELRHKATAHTLFSLTKVQWGSGGQIVSAIPDNLKPTQLDSTSWVVRSAPSSSRILSDEDLKYFSTGSGNASLDTAFSSRPSGSPVKCGDQIRLEHAESTRVLKGNATPSLIGSGLEVVAGGSTADDSNIFIVECSTKDWEMEKPVLLKHKEHNGYVTTSKKALFTQHNCPRCPIKRHTDVHINTRPGRNLEPHEWVAHSVMTVSLNEDELDDDEAFQDHDEL